MQIFTGSFKEDKFYQIRYSPDWLWVTQEQPPKSGEIHEPKAERVTLLLARNSKYLATVSSHSFKVAL